MPEARSFPRTDALDVIVELISELDETPRPGGRGFYDRLCEALCRQAVDEARRADALRRRAPARRPGGKPRSRGAACWRAFTGASRRRPIAQLALSAGPRGPGVRGARALGARPLRGLRPSRTRSPAPPSRPGALARRDLRRPRRRAASSWATTSATPCGRSARRRRSPPAFASRPTSKAAPACSRPASTWRARSTSAWCSASSASRSRSGRRAGLSDEARRRCADEMQAALADLRDALERPLAPAARGHRRDPARRARPARRQLQGPAPGARLASRAWRCRRELEPLAQSVLAEALRNADKHASPRAWSCAWGASDGTFVLEVRNDGAVARRARGTGMGLRLAAVEALQCGGVVEFGPEGVGRLAGAARGAGEGRPR